MNNCGGCGVPPCCNIIEGLFHDGYWIGSFFISNFVALFILVITLAIMSYPEVSAWLEKRKECNGGCLRR